MKMMIMIDIILVMIPTFTLLFFVPCFTNYDHNQIDLIVNAECNIIYFC